MAQVGTLISFSPSTTIVSADVDQNFDDLKSAINTAVFTDATNTITVFQRFANAVWLKGRNAGNTADVNIIRVNSSDQVELTATMVTSTHLPSLSATYNLGSAALLWAGVYTTILEVNNGVALGGGASPTLGTIGGSGPATAGQNSWLKVKIGGTDSYIPIWR